MPPRSPAGTLPIWKAANGWSSQPAQEISMNARNNAAAPDRRKNERPGKKAAPISRSNARAGAAASNVTAFPQAHRVGLSNRAQNVLKILAAELMGECPPRESWIPSGDLLQRLTFKHLSTARNCGPRTIREIVEWTALRGVTIQPPPRAGRSLSDTWKGIGTRFAAGELTQREMTEALDRSIRRKSTTIPVAIQKILLQLLNGTDKPSRS